MFSPIKIIKPVSFTSDKYFDFKPRVFTINQYEDDAFQKSDAGKKDDFERLHSNPNTAFLYRGDISYQNKIKILAQHPEIVDIADIEAENFFMPGSLKLGKFFEIERLWEYKKPTRYFIDTTVDINKKNLDRIKANKNNLLTRLEYINLTGTTSAYLSRQKQAGNVSAFELYSKDTGELTPSPLLYLDRKNVKSAVNNVQKVGATTKYFDELIKFSSNPVLVNIGTLSKLGFGDYKKIYSLIKQGILEGRIVNKEAEGKNKISAFVDINSKKSAGILKSLREKQCLEINQADNLFGLSKQELFDAFCTGELECYTEALLIGDIDKIFIDMKSEKNKNTFNKLLFQKELLNGLTEENFYRTETCPRIKLAWYLSPKTRQVAKELMQNDFDIQNIIKKRNQEKTLANIEINSLQPDNQDLQNTTLTYRDILDSDNMVIEEFFEKVWQKAGVEEYQNALIEADSILQGDIDDIQDEEMKNVLLYSYSGSKNDFLNFMQFVK